MSPDEACGPPTSSQRHPDIPTLLPSELLFFDELLALERAFTVDDFGKALLAHKRLGLLLRR